MIFNDQSSIYLKRRCWNFCISLSHVFLMSLTYVDAVPSFFLLVLCKNKIKWKKYKNATRTKTKTNKTSWFLFHSPAFSYVFYIFSLLPTRTFSNFKRNEMKKRKILQRKNSRADICETFIDEMNWSFFLWFFLYFGGQEENEIVMKRNEGSWDEVREKYKNFSFAKSRKWKTKVNQVAVN